jgi:YkoY family integral membrane protein
MTVDHLIEGLPVILTLIIIEGLLSVDNALAIAAMASHLPGKQKQLALRLGILGAYVFRGVALAVAGIIKDEIWLRYLGAVYLFYLLARHFVEKHEGKAHGEGHPVHEPEEILEDTPYRQASKVAHLVHSRHPHEESAPVAEPKPETGLQEAAKATAAAHSIPVKAGLVATVCQIEIMDLALSFDNVIAAVAISDKMWAIVTGVFIGILALRLVAGYAIKLIERFPILADAAFLLIGYIGCILLAETLFDKQIHALEHTYHFKVHTWMPAIKFTGIVVILGLCLLYEKKAWMRTLFKPLIVVTYPLLWLLNKAMSLIGWPFVAVGTAIGRAFSKRKGAATPGAE